ARNIRCSSCFRCAKARRSPKRCSSIISTAAWTSPSSRSSTCSSASCARSSPTRRTAKTTSRRCGAAAMCCASPPTTTQRSRPENFYQARFENPGLAAGVFVSCMARSRDIVQLDDVALYASLCAFTHVLSHRMIAALGAFNMQRRRVTAPRQRSRLGFALLVAMALLGGAPHARAVEGTTAAGPVGGSDVRVALLPPPGLYGGVAFFAGNAPRLVDGKGHDIPGLSPHFTIKAAAPFGLYVPDVQVLGGSIAVFGVLPY